MSRARGLALAALALALAVVFSLLAVDVIHRERAMGAGDVRFGAGPSPRDLWRASEIVPMGAVRTMLAVDDDLDYREAMRVFKLARPRDQGIGQFNLPANRAHAEDVISRIAETEEDDGRRSQLVNLLGVLALSRAAPDIAQSPSLLDEAASTFRLALRDDPENEDAKANLELVLRVKRDQQRQQSGESAGPGNERSRVGLSDTGSGY